MSILDLCPTAPDWKVDWAHIRATYAWAEALHECPQDVAFHAEGDVGIHTRMACEALASSDEFRGLPAAERRVVFAAVVLHDVAKPACTRQEGGRLRAPGHSVRGDIAVRALLWRDGVPFAEREKICGLVRYHQVPFFLIDRDDCQRLAYRVSQIARCDHLCLVAWADGSGRRCADAADQTRILDNVALFRAYCGEHACLTGPRQFPSDHSRFLYFRKDDRDPDYLAHDDTRCEVTLMSGLPAAGKDHWVRRNAGDLPVVSLDKIRSELDISPAAPQRRVVDEARARARRFLAQGQPFVWNATNVSRTLRDSLVSLFADYNARIRIVYVEAPEPAVQQRNRARPSPVPRRVMDKLVDRWTIPSTVDAHQVVFCVE